MPASNIDHLQTTGEQSASLFLSLALSLARSPARRANADQRVFTTVKFERTASVLALSLSLSCSRAPHIGKGEGEGSVGRQIRVRRRADIAPSTQRRVPSTRLGDISRFSYLSVNSHVGGDERGREREIFAVGVVSRTQEEYRTRFDIGEISDASARAIRKWPRKIGNRVVGVALSSTSQPFTTSIVRQPVKL